MAERRMFTKKITDSDAFTALPPTTQALYFHLCMGADDDGFSDKIRNAMFFAHADSNDFNLLVQKRFIIPFDSGVIVIKHWRMHNLIKSDRYHETAYIEERAALVLKDNGAYTEATGTEVEPSWNPSGTQVEPQYRLGKVSKGKSNNKGFAPPTVDEVRAYCLERNNAINAEAFIDYYTAQGWRLSNGQPLKDWKAAVRNWERRDSNRSSQPHKETIEERNNRLLEEARALWEQQNQQ